MNRVVIAATTLLALIGAVVVVAYLLIFGAATDRAAAIAPARSLAYVSMYLTPSTGQQMNLQRLLTKLPGFTDEAQLGTNIDVLVQRLLGDAGVDYHADVKPWLGGEVAVAVLARGAGPRASTDARPVIPAVAGAARAPPALPPVRA